MDDLIFTLAQACDMVPQLERLLAEIQRERARLQQTQAMIEAIHRSGGSDGGAVHTDTREFEAEARRSVEDMRSLVTELRSTGVHLKDLDRGLLDWPARHEGHSVYLCWQQGEPTVAWWHEIAAGFAGRRPVIPDEWD